MKLDHIGIVVKDLEEAKNYYKNHYDFDDCSSIIDETTQNVKIIFIKVGFPELPVIEIIQPINEKSPIYNFLKKTGGGLHHMAYEVENLDKSISHFKNLKSITIGDIYSSAGHEGRRVIWFYTIFNEMIELIEQKKSKCLICGHSDFNDLIYFDKYPLYIGVLPPKLYEKVKNFPLKICQCKKCNHIQQMDRLSNEYKDILYKNKYSELLSSVPTPSKTGIGKSECEKCFDFFKKCNLPHGNVLEIGCYDGYFLSLIKIDGYNVQGIDPNPISKIAAEKYNIHIIKDFFSEKYFNKNTFDIIILRNILEHIDDLHNFIDDVNNILKPEGHIIIEVPNISFLLKKGALGCFFHQHSSYFSIDVLIYFLSKHSLKYVNSYEEYAIYLCVKKIKDEEKQKIYIKNKNIEIKHYFLEYKKIKNDLIKILKKEDNIAIFGAGGHTTGLVHMLDNNITNKIKYVYDNNVLKQCNYIANIPVMIRSPEFIKKDNPNILIISSYIYQSIILKQIKKMKIDGLKIVTIYPTVKIYE